MVFAQADDAIAQAIAMSMEDGADDEAADGADGAGAMEGEDDEAAAMARAIAMSMEGGDEDAAGGDAAGAGVGAALHPALVNCLDCRPFGRARTGVALACCSAVLSHGARPAGRLFTPARSVHKRP